VEAPGWVFEDVDDLDIDGRDRQAEKILGGGKNHLSDPGRGAEQVSPEPSGDADVYPNRWRSEYPAAGGVTAGWLDEVYLATADAQCRHLGYRMAQDPGGGDAVDAGVTMPGGQRQVVGGPQLREHSAHHSLRQ
jgi:hypothetical protein